MMRLSDYVTLAITLRLDLQGTADVLCRLCVFVYESTIPHANAEKNGPFAHLLHSSSV